LSNKLHFPLFTRNDALYRTLYHNIYLCYTYNMFYIILFDTRLVTTVEYIYINARIYLRIRVRHQFANNTHNIRFGCGLYRSINIVYYCKLLYRVRSGQTFSIVRAASYCVVTCETAVKGLSANVGKGEVVLIE
jgi:hypothetical protein